MPQEHQRSTLVVLMTTIISTVARTHRVHSAPQLSWLDRARATAPVVARWRDEGEQQRQLPRPLFEALRDTGLFAIGASLELGGAQVGHEDFLRVIEELSRQDGSVGWNVTIAAH